MPNDTDDAQRRPMVLPARGYPNSEQALRAWFRRTRGREALEAEIGALMSAMNARDSGRPGIGPRGAL